MVFRKTLKPKRKTTGMANDFVLNVLKSLKFDPSIFGAFDLWDNEARNFVRGCKSVALQGTVLYVEVPSSAHRQEIFFYKERLLKKINQTMGRRAITEIRFELAQERMKGGV